MKRLISIILCLALLYAGCCFAALAIARRALQSVFIDSSVRIGACYIHPLRQIRFLRLEVSRPDVYYLNISDASIRYNLFSLCRGVIKEVELSQSQFNLNLGQKDIAQFSRYLKIKKAGGVFSVERIAVSGLDLTVKSSNVNLRATLWSDILASQQTVGSLLVVVQGLDAFGVQAASAYLYAAQGKPGGRLYAKDLRYKRLKVTQAKGAASLEGGQLLLEPLAVDIFSGRLSGSAYLNLSQEPTYRCKLKAEGLSIETIVDDLKLRERVQMEGRLTGSLELEGRAASFKVLEGSFFALEPGGTLTIHDRNFLEALSRNSQQPLEMVVESFRDYRYNNGIIKLYLESGNAVLGINLDGSQGKRNLTITLHDFNLRRN